MNRREFLKTTSVLGVGATAAAMALDATSSHAATPVDGSEFASLAILLDPADPVANSAPVLWALEQLHQALSRHQVGTRILPPNANTARENQHSSFSNSDKARVQETSAAISQRLLVAGGAHPLARDILDRARVTLPAVAESLVIVPGRVVKQPVLCVCGSDPRGLQYAVLELADRVAHAGKPFDAFKIGKPIVERPANRIRSIMRVFASDIEDLSWFHDRSFWPRYLSMLAAERFNRFNLALGLGYDFTSGIRDAYFHFAYPFLLEVPGYDVQVKPFSKSDQARNLESLRFISQETAARGLHFQLGIWTHAYKWTDSPQANYTIEGLTSQNHAAYCRDALRTLLQACPAISGVTFRVHGESGVAEGSYAFWKTVFEGLTGCGRPVEIDMHAKGMDDQMIELALATRLPVNISPKFWAEHMGLPYHQAGIRPTEMPAAQRPDSGFFSKSSGSRSFLRYGYGDLLSEKRRYGVLHRMWPGTQRLLLWGDPAFAASYGRAASFCGSHGLELFEPLSFKGRKGSGLAGGRDAYADAALKSAGGDFEKYSFNYRLWGRLLYNPDTPPDVWQRQLKREYGTAAATVETALANASRILPLITTAHLPSAANNNYWPELYTNMSLLASNRRSPYGDTPSPKRFGTVSPLDPQLFSRIEDFADELLEGKVSGKYSPAEVARWLLLLADRATLAVSQSVKQSPAAHDPGLRRVSADVAIQAGLGRFFAEKLRASVLFALHERRPVAEYGQQALAAYRRAREAWAQLANQAARVYAPDITFGLEPQLRGHWRDRLQVIDEDIIEMQNALQRSTARKDVSSVGGADQDAAIQAVLNPPAPPSLSIRCVPPTSFNPGRPLEISVPLPPGSSGRALSARLFYRHTNQAETFHSTGMVRRNGALSAEIPASYTDSVFPLQYYFEFRDQNRAWLHPGLGPNLTGQPYYVVRAPEKARTSVKSY